MCELLGKKGEGVGCIRRRTYINFVDGAVASQPDQALAHQTVNEEVFSTEQCLPEALGLCFLLDAFRGSQIRVSANEPVRAGVQRQSDNIAE